MIQILTKMEFFEVHPPSGIKNYTKYNYTNYNKNLSESSWLLEVC